MIPWSFKQSSTASAGAPGTYLSHSSCLHTQLGTSTRRNLFGPCKRLHFCRDWGCTDLHLGEKTGELTNTSILHSRCPPRAGALLCASRTRDSTASFFKMESKSAPGSRVCNRQCQRWGGSSSRALLQSQLCPLWANSAPFSRTPLQSPSCNISTGPQVLAKLDKFRRFATSRVL